MPQTTLARCLSGPPVGGSHPEPEAAPGLRLTEAQTTIRRPVEGASFMFTSEPPPSARTAVLVRFIDGLKALRPAEQSEVLWPHPVLVTSSSVAGTEMRTLGKFRP